MRSPYTTSLPRLGFGVWQSRDAYSSTLKALEAGYRHIDTAQFYGNEAAVGEAVRSSGLPRESVFVTTKIPPNESSALESLRHSVRTIGLGHVDLFLIHWSSGNKKQRLAMWQDLTQFYREGGALAIGVSNYSIDLLEELKREAELMPAVNQIEIHPWKQQRSLVEYCQKENIVVEAYCPLVRGERWEDKTLQRIAKVNGKDPGQILLRWSLQHGFVPLPKSDTPSRIVSNADLYDFELSEADMKDLDGLDPKR